MERVDFHIHYDPQNEDTAFEAIDLAREKQVKAISLLARGEVSDNIRCFIKYGQSIGVEVVPGIEAFVGLDDRVVELVILAFDCQSPKVKDLFGGEQNKSRNKEIAHEQKKFLEEIGFSFENLEEDERDLLSSILDGKILEKAGSFCSILAGSQRNRDQIELLKRENPKIWVDTQERFSEMMGDNQKRLDAKFLWMLLFSPGSLGYIPPKRIAEGVIDAIHSAGGVVLYSPEGKFCDLDWDKLVGMGIDGLMAWHGGEIEISADRIVFLRRKGLLILGGSDFDPKKNHWQIGEGDGKMFISKRRFCELKQYLEKRFHEEP